MSATTERQAWTAGWQHQAQWTLKGEPLNAEARLIAAAPALVEALRGLIEGIEGRERRTGIAQMVPIVDQARAALALVEG